MKRASGVILTNLIPPVLYAALIFYLSSKSFEGTHLEHGLDKGIHLLVYAGLGYLILRAFSKNRWEKGKYIWATTLVFLYGISDEIHQSFVPGREFSILDMVADGAGGMVAAVVCAVAESRRWAVWF